MNITVLDEVGMAIDECRADASTVSVRWCTSDGSDHVVGVAQPILENVGGSERGDEGSGPSPSARAPSASASAALVGGSRMLSMQLYS